MQYICDATGDTTWFRIESEGEALLEAQAMNHAVDRYFRQEQDRARSTYKPPEGAHSVERDIGLKAHLARQMPIFLTLRDREGNALVTAMLPPQPSSSEESKTPAPGRTIIVGPGNEDPYPQHAAAIRDLAQYYGLDLEREHCFPYQRRSG